VASGNQKITYSVTPPLLEMSDAEISYLLLCIIHHFLLFSGLALPFPSSFMLCFQTEAESASPTWSNGKEALFVPAQASKEVASREPHFAAIAVHFAFFSPINR